MGHPRFVGDTRLEQQLQPKLDLPRSSRRCTDNPAVGDASASAVGVFGRRAGAINNRVRRSEIGVVQHVKELRAELCAKPLMDRGALSQGEIQLREPRTGKRVAAEIAECTRVRRSRRQPD